MILSITAFLIIILSFWGFFAIFWIYVSYSRPSKIAEVSNFSFYLFENNRLFFRIGGIWLILFGFVAFVFGIHADIYTDYDKWNSNLTPHYNWFNPSDVIKFPKDQLEQNYIDTAVSNRLNRYEERSKTREYTILIDVTQNMPTPENGQSYISEIESILRDTIKTCDGAFGNNEINYSEWDFRDLSSFYWLCYLKYHSDQTTKVSIVYYFGNNKFMKVVEKTEIGDWKTIVNEFHRFLGKKDYNSEYANTKRELVRDGQTIHSDFGNVLTTMNTANHLLGESEASRFSTFIMISDFDHDVESDINQDELQVNINKFYQDPSLPVDQVNLVKTPSNKEKTENTKSIIHLLKSQFSNTHKFEINHDQFFNKNIALETVRDMFSSVHLMERSGMYFHSSWDEKSSCRTYKCKLKMPPLSPTSSLKLKIRLTDHSNETAVPDGEMSYLKVNAKKIVANSSAINYITIGEKAPLEIEFKTKTNEPFRYSVEFGTPKGSYFMSEPIILRESLPKTSSIALIICYAHMLLASCCIFLYPAVKTAPLLAVVGVDNRLLDKTLSCALFSTFAFVAAYVLKYLFSLFNIPSTNIMEYQTELITSLVIAGGVYFIVLRRQLQRSMSEAKKLFNQDGTKQ